MRSLYFPMKQKHVIDQMHSSSMVIIPGQSSSLLTSSIFYIHHMIHIYHRISSQPTQGQSKNSS